MDDPLLYETLLTSLSPYISEGVINYYGYPKSYGLYDAKLVSIERSGEGEFNFKVIVKVYTFEHAHNPPYGKETMTFDISPMGIKRMDYDHEGDEEERKTTQFYAEVISEIKQSFDLNLESYEEYNDSQLQYKAEKQKEYQSLAKITESIIVNILNPEIHPPYKNVIDPVTFILGDSGYILFKRADGTNTIFEVVSDKQEWKVINEKSKKGKIMKKELIWYM